MSIMPDKDCVIAFIIHYTLTHFLFKNRGVFKKETLVDLTSRNHYRAERAIIMSMLAKVSFMSAKTTSHDLKMSIINCITRRKIYTE